VTSVNGADKHRPKFSSCYYITRNTAGMSRLPEFFCWQQRSQRLFTGWKTAEAAEF